jgi:hypothetical protein
VDTNFPIFVKLGLNSLPLDYSASRCKVLSTVKGVFGYLRECLDLNASGSILLLRKKQNGETVTEETMMLEVACSKRSVNGLFLILVKVLKPSS